MRMTRKSIYEGPKSIQARLFKFTIKNDRDSVRAMMTNPRDRTPEVAAAVNQVGGTIRHTWITVSDYDTVVIAELPDEIAANALWSVFKAGAGVVRIDMEPMITLAQHVRALKLAGEIDYLPPQGQTWDRSKFGPAPRPGSGKAVYNGNGFFQLFKVELMDCNPDSIRAMITEPHDRTPAVAACIKQVGGALLHAWVTLRQYDTIMILKVPDLIAANALWSVFKAGAGVVEISMEPMLTLEEHVKALKLAAEIDYLPPQGRTWEASQFAHGGDSKTKPRQPKGGEKR